MPKNDSPNYPKEDSINYTFAEGFFTEAPDETMDLYKRRRSMDSEFRSGKKYKTDQRLDDAKKEPKGPPDGFIFDR